MQPFAKFPCGCVPFSAGECTQSVQCCCFFDRTITLHVMGELAERSRVAQVLSVHDFCRGGLKVGWDLERSIPFHFRVNYSENSATRRIHDSAQITNLTTQIFFCF